VIMDKRKEVIALNLNPLPIGVCKIRGDFTISFWNQTIEQWTGISSKEAIDRPLEEVIPFFAIPQKKNRLNLVFKGGGPAIFSSRFNPRIFPLQNETQNEGKYQRITITPFELSDGEQRAMIAIEDVTAITEQVFQYRKIKDQIAYELEEKKKTEQALAMTLSKLNTLASITRHDLNNILTVFEGYLGILLIDKPGGKLQTYLERMKESSDLMKRHIAFAKDYQEMGNALPTWFSIESLIRTSAIGPAFAGIELSIDVGNLEILADPLIVKAIYNLLENAVRHGEHTTIITVTSLAVHNDIIIFIEDNGKGVPADIKSKIFNKGFGSNTGLGLFLTREILGITGMQIIETGVEGKGAKFEIRVTAGHFRYSN